MYPFERFTERAKKALTLAQEEANAAGHGYIGTEHLLLALLREEEGIAHGALRALGVDPGWAGQVGLGVEQRLCVEFDLAEFGRQRAF